ncbi:hypothetical protein M0R72_20530 [Candidatus Pacearchaeota archaeon]|jgi:uroporphyrinogen-III decarboxylase|nr:hypothetical protein [Candidatus Pacearchaeota archaeon]
MKTMSSRERLICTLRGQIPDRVPVAPFVQEEYLSFYYPYKEKVDRVVDAKELADEYDFDLIAKPRIFELPHFFQKNYSNWEVRRSVRRTPGCIHHLLEIVTPRGTLVQEEVGADAGAASTGIHNAFSRYMLDSQEAIRIFFEFLPPLDGAFVEETRKTVASWRGVMGERGILAPWGWSGVFNFASNLCGIEALMTAPYEDEEAYRQFMGRLSDAMAGHTRALASTELECIGVQGNMANSAVMNSDFFRKFVQPYEQKLLDVIHARGKFSVYHNCGFAKQFYPNYREMGMTLWETVSAPPQGDNDLSDAKAKIGDRICLLGNLDQIHFLKTATQDEVAERTRRIVQTGKPGGRYIFSTSDFLEKATPRENVAAMIAAAKDAGTY